MQGKTRISARFSRRADYTTQHNKTVLSPPAIFLSPAAKSTPRQRSFYGTRGARPRRSATSWSSPPNNPQALPECRRRTQPRRARRILFVRRRGRFAMREGTSAQIPAEKAGGYATPQSTAGNLSGSGKKYSAIKQTFNPKGATSSLNANRFGVSKACAASTRERYFSRAGNRSVRAAATTLEP